MVAAMRTSARFSPCGLAFAAMLSGGCFPSPPIALISAPLDPWFTLGTAAQRSLGSGGTLESPGGGDVRIPGASGDQVLTIVVAAARAETAELFGELNSGAALSGAIRRIDLRAETTPPDYLIITLPAAGDASRIYVAGYLDEDTGQPDWTPAPSTFDAGTGMLTACVGLGMLQGVESGSAGSKGAAALQGSGNVTYTGYVGVGVGGQQFNAQIVFVAQAPTGPVDAPFGSAPIDVQARVGVALSNITNPPLSELTVTSDFGPRAQPIQGASTNHRGVDYRAANGTNVFAAGDGTVVTARCQLNSVNCGRAANGDITGGFIVEIDHGNGETTRYLHMTNPASVQAGAKVTAGQVIGLSDSSGGVAPHLHFEVRKNGTAVDPELIYDNMATVTIGMAIDYIVQDGTKRQLSVTRGIITPADMQLYSAAASLDGIAPGEHRLQFVVVEPSGTLEVLGEVPLTVGAAFLGLTGSQLRFTDLTWTFPEWTDYETARTEAVFSLVAIDNSRLQGQAHITYSRFFERHRTTVMTCPVSTDTYGPVEWNASLEGQYSVLEDGSIYITFSATPFQSPDYEFHSTRPGCPELDDSDTLPGVSWSGMSATLIGGQFDEREDFFHENATGKDYFEAHLRWTTP